MVVPWRWRAFADIYGIDGSFSFPPLISSPLLSGRYLINLNLVDPLTPPIRTSPCGRILGFRVFEDPPRFHGVTQIGLNDLVFSQFSQWVHRCNVNSCGVVLHQTRDLSWSLPRFFDDLLLYLTERPISHKLVYIPPPFLSPVVRPVVNQDFPILGTIANHLSPSPTGRKKRAKSEPANDRKLTDGDEINESTPGGLSFWKDWKANRDIHAIFFFSPAHFLIITPLRKHQEGWGLRESRPTGPTGPMGWMRILCESTNFCRHFYYDTGWWWMVAINLLFSHILLGC